MMRRMRCLPSLIVLGICACSGSPKPVPQPTPTPTPHPEPTPTPTPHPTPTPVPEAVFSVPDATEPEFFPPAWKQVGIGQKISFSTAVIDPDLDRRPVEGTQSPASG